MRRLILVKHSLPKIVPELPRREWVLSEEGRERAARLAEQLRAYEPERIATSPEPKARQTAEILAGSLGLDLAVVEGLREHDDRDVPFLSEDGFRARVREFFARPAETVFGPESADAAYARFADAIDSLSPVEDGRSQVAVAHGRVISLFAARRGSVDPHQLWLRLGLPSMVIVGLPRFEIEEVAESV